MTQKRKTKKNRVMPLGPISFRGGTPGRGVQFVGVVCSASEMVASSQHDGNVQGLGDMPLYAAFRDNEKGSEPFERPRE